MAWTGEGPNGEDGEGGEGNGDVKDGDPCRGTFVEKVMERREDLYRRPKVFL